MSSRGKYAGQPLTFRCTRCKRWHGSRSHHARGTYFVTTGRTRKQRSSGINHKSWPNVACEYECTMCGHKGWSRHPDVHRQYRADHGKEATA